MTAVPNLPGRPEPRLQAVAEPRLSDGRRKGDHGNRADTRVRDIVMGKLEAAATAGTPVSPAQLADWALMAGVGVRQLQRWRKEVLHKHAQGVVDQPLHAVDDIVLYKAREVLDKGARTPFIPALDVIEEIHTKFATPHKAWLTLSKDPAHPLYGMSRATFYQGLDRVQKGVRAGLLRGVPAMREHTLSLPRQMVDQVNHRWSIDEYEVKVEILDPLSGVVEPTKLHVLIVRDEHDDLPRAWRRFLAKPNSADAAALIAEAVIGWEHDGVQVVGPAEYLRCDQGFISAEMRRKMAFLGTQLSPAGSYWPDGNGGHERPHRDYGALLRLLPGATKGPEDHTGAPYGKGTYATLAEVDAALEALFDEARFTHRPNTARHAGRTRFELYRDCVEQGMVADRPQLTDANVAPLAITVGERLANARAGVRFRKHDYLSAEFAEHGYTGPVTVGTLRADDGEAPATLYAFDDDGRFLALLWRRDLIPDAELAYITQLRRERRQYVHTVHRTTHVDRKARTNVAPLPAPSGADPQPLQGSLDAVDHGDLALADTVAGIPAVQALLADPDALEALRRLTDDELAQLQESLQKPTTDATDGAADRTGDEPTPATDAADGLGDEPAAVADAAAATAPAAAPARPVVPGPATTGATGKRTPPARSTPKHTVPPVNELSDPPTGQVVDDVVALLNAGRAKKEKRT